MKPYFFIALWAAAFALVSCSAPKASILPVSKEATYIENISGKDDKLLGWGIGEDNAAAEIDAKKSALWAVMCGGGVGNQVALLSTQERLNADGFIRDFFADESQWSQFVRSTTQGRIDPDKRLKMSDGRVKLGVEVIVSRNLLREYLEAKNVAGSMRMGK